MGILFVYEIQAGLNATACWLLSPTYFRNLLLNDRLVMIFGIIRKIPKRECNPLLADAGWLSSLIASACI